jgi:hypothetical protein
MLLAAPPQNHGADLPLLPRKQQLVAPRQSLGDLLPRGRRLR